MIYVMCYDIANPKRLAKVAKILENSGIRVQKSIFQCDIEDQVMRSIFRKVEIIIKKKEDSFFIYPLCLDCVKTIEIDGVENLLDLANFRIL